MVEGTDRLLDGASHLDIEVGQLWEGGVEERSDEGQAEVGLEVRERPDRGRELLGFELRLVVGRSWAAQQDFTFQAMVLPSNAE